MADAVHVRPLLLDDAALLGKRFADLDSGLESVHPVENRSSVGDSAALIHDRRHSQPMPQSDLEVIGIVGRCHFDCTRSEFGIDVVVGNDDESTIDERVRQRGADQMAVARVGGVHSDRSVAEHRLYARGGDDDVRFGIVK